MTCGSEHVPAVSRASPTWTAPLTPCARGCRAPAAWWTGSSPPYARRHSSAGCCRSTPPPDSCASQRPRRPERCAALGAVSRAHWPPAAACPRVLADTRVTVTMTLAVTLEPLPAEAAQVRRAVAYATAHELGLGIAAEWEGSHPPGQRRGGNVTAVDPRSMERAVAHAVLSLPAVAWLEPSLGRSLAHAAAHTRRSADTPSRAPASAPVVDTPAVPGRSRSAVFSPRAPTRSPPSGPSAPAPGTPYRHWSSLGTTEPAPACGTLRRTSS